MATVSVACGIARSLTVAVVVPLVLRRLRVMAMTSPTAQCLLLVHTVVVPVRTLRSTSRSNTPPPLPPMEPTVTVTVAVVVVPLTTDGGAVASGPCYAGCSVSLASCCSGVDVA